MTPWEAMRQLTERQYLVSLHWLDLQWDRPDLNGWLLMQVAAEVRRVLSKHPNRVKLKDFKLKFDRKKQADKKLPLTPQEKKLKDAAVKSHWIAAVGGNVIRKSAETGEVINGGRGNRAGKAGGPPGGGRGTVRPGHQKERGRNKTAGLQDSG